MYTTCLFCDAALGRNDAVEEMPVGRRLAFDADKGRLWVVCRACERWNLTPMEERWEAIETCDRLFRGTRVRVSTGNVGLAKLADGTELVRIGAPLRPEFAAWRYGDQFGRRRRRVVAAGSLGIVAAVAAAPVAVSVAATLLLSGGILAAGWVSAGAQIPYQMAKDYLTSDRVLARLPVAGVGLATVRVRHLRESALLWRDGDVTLRLAHDGGETAIAGDGAQRALGVVLAHSNQWGGSAGLVREAVDRIDARGDVAGWLRTAARLSTRPGGRVMAEMRRVGALGLTPVERLALEMALHEDAERRVLDGELTHLAEAWRAADAIAVIVDSL